MALDGHGGVLHETAPRHPFTGASVLRRMGKAAGFTGFETLDLDHPVNAFYVLRP